MPKKSDFFSSIRSFFLVSLPNLVKIAMKYTKQYWKIIVPVLISIVLVCVFVIYKQSRLPELFAYVPADAEQVVINRPARNISNIGESIAQVPEGVKAQFEQIELMLMVQMEQSTGGQLIFLQTYNDFDPQSFLETLNGQSEITSTYKSLEDGIYVFGTKKMIDKYAKPIDEKLFFQGSLSDFVSTYKKYGMTIISNNTNALGLPSQFEQIFANVEYIVMAVNSENTNIQFASHVIFREDHPFTGSHFSLAFKDYLKASTIGYIELSSLSTFLPEPELNTSLTGENLVKQAILAETIQELGKQHIGLVLSKGSNATNLGLTILAANSNLFASLKPWIPTMGEWIQNQEWLSGIQLEPIEKEKSVGYMATLEEGQQIGLLLEQGDGETAFRIGNPLLDGSSSQSLWYDSNSLATINIDLDQAVNIYKQIANMGLQTNLESLNTLSEQFKGKSFNVHIFAESHGLGLEGAIE